MVILINTSLKPKPEAPVEVVLISVPTPPPPKKPVIPPPPIPEVRPNEKLIEIAKMLESEVAPKTSLLSEKNQSTSKQTQKKNKIKNDQADLDKELKKEKGELLRQAQESGGLNKIKDVEEGIEDLLNTREFKFFSYFKKLKSTMNVNWEQQLLSDRNVASEQLIELQSGAELVTKLFIIIGAAGELESVTILKSCGFESLDEAVVAAFRKASPFEKPPQGILEADGSIKITWDFVLD